MRVAVISNQETQQGRSSFMIILASLFSKVQRERVVLASNVGMEYLLNCVEVRETASLTKSLSVLKVRMDEADIKSENILDYGIRIGEEEVYVFDIMNTNMHDADKDELLESIINIEKVPLVLVEIAGDVKSDRNRKLIERCDVVINIYNNTRQSIDKVNEYQRDYYPDIVNRTGFVCQKFDDKAGGEKKLAKDVSTHTRNNMVVPYSPVIQKLCMEGSLNKLARLLITGHEETIHLRPKLIEIMQYLFDSPTVKYIKGVDKWPK